ncbi:MAG: BlaI/MecI/CopY family transcriptional regulator [Candidatus Saliniplasma sp.]
MGEEELKKEIESLKKQVDTMQGMLKNLMDMHKNVLQKVSMDSDIEKRYLKMLSLYKRYGKISPSVLPDIKDPISENIVEILLDTKSANITQITERMRHKKGSASRHTVRDRLKKLEEKNVVKRVESGTGKNYTLTDKIIEKWAELLGIKK